MASLALQIDLWCAETGVEVEGLLKQTMDGRDERGKKAIVPMYTLDEVLNEGFVAKEGPRRYRTAEEVRQAMQARQHDEDGPEVSTAIDIEDVIED